MKRVTVGMPVRNGAPLLAVALESIIGQDYDDLDILVSDNASTDETPAIIADFQRRDARIRSVRHATPMPALNHFHWVKGQARGEYFMWAAHDDVRSTDFVSALARGLDEHPSAVLAFGDVHVSREPCRIGDRRRHDFETEGRGLLGRVRKAASGQCFHLYGLWRSEVLRRIPEAYALWWPDLPILTAAACMGEFIHVAGPRFGYYETFKSNAARAEYQDLGEQFHRLGSMLELQRAVWRSCSAVAGPAAAALAVACVAAKHASEVPGFLVRRTRDRIVRP